MADLSQKKGSFIRRYVAAIEALLANSAELSALGAEWTANGYPTGGSPPENNITDEDLAAVAPWLTASQLDSSIGAASTINGTIDQWRGYLEAVRS